MTLFSRRKAKLASASYLRPIVVAPAGTEPAPPKPPSGGGGIGNATTTYEKAKTKAIEEALREATPEQRSGFANGGRIATVTTEGSRYTVKYWVNPAAAARYGKDFLDSINQHGPFPPKPDFKVGDRVLVTLRPSDPCAEFSGWTGNIERTDDQGGFYVYCDGRGLRTTADELTLVPERPRLKFAGLRPSGLYSWEAVNDAARALYPDGVWVHVHTFWQGKHTTISILGNKRAAERARDAAK